MRHQSIHFEHSHELSNPPGLLFLGFIGGSWVAVIGAAQLGTQLFAALTGA